MGAAKDCPSIVLPSSLSSTSLSIKARLLAFVRLYARVTAFVAASRTALLV